MDIMTENYCTGCDFVVHQVFDDEYFYAHRVGPVKCPNCGTVVMPCNDCDNCDANYNRDCDNCPWKKSMVSIDMDDEEYVSWYKKNDSEVFKMMLNGELGEEYQKIAKSLK